jgi:hypothetical protein
MIKDPELINFFWSLVDKAGPLPDSVHRYQDAMLAMAGNLDRERLWPVQV